MNIRRAAGVLLHPTSLPGRFGIGDFGDEVMSFLDWAEEAGLRVWQILPLNPPGYGNSPYGCHSSYAGNPLLISPQHLVEDGLLPTVGDVPHFPDDHVDFDRVTEFKNRLLRTSFEHFNAHGRSSDRYAQRRFEEDNAWLEDWAIYAALKDRYAGLKWTEWPHAIAIRDPTAMAAAPLASSSPWRNCRCLEKRVTFNLGRATAGAAKSSAPPASSERRESM